jgi:hypothetical protein
MDASIVRRTRRATRSRGSQKLVWFIIGPVQSERHLVCAEQSGNRSTVAIMQNAVDLRSVFLDEAGSLRYALSRNKSTYRLGTSHPRLRSSASLALPRL